MEALFRFIDSNSTLLILYSIGINIILLFLFFINSFKFSKMEKMYRSLTRDMKGKNLEQLIHQYYEKIDGVDIRINNVDMQLTNIEEKLLKSIQHIGIVRYDAFDDMGGNLSFSLALLNQQHDGFILTSIYNRNNNVIYGKPIRGGKSSYQLSAEELQALDRAKANSLDEYVKKTDESGYKSNTF